MMAASSEDTLKRTAYLYNLIYTVGWAPPILIAIAGIIVFPGLTGVAVDDIIPLMFFKYLPTWGIGIMLAAFLSAMMSTMDAQLITLSTLFTRDVLGNLTSLPERTQVTYGRISIIILGAIGYILSLIRPGTIFDIFTIAGMGFISLAPTIFATLYWKRFNRYGATAQLLSSALLAVFYYTGIFPPEAAFGFLPQFPILVFSAIIMVVVTYLTPSEPIDITEKFFKVFEKSSTEEHIATLEATK